MLEWHNPWYLAVLGVAIPLIAMLFYLARRKAQIQVPSLRFYPQEALERGEKALHRLRIPLEMILLLISILALVLSLAEPIYKHPLGDGRKVVVHIDSSPAMQTVVEGVSYLERAKEAVRAMAEQHDLFIVGGNPEGTEIEFDDAARRLEFLKAKNLARRMNAQLILVSYSTKAFGVAWSPQVVAVGRESDNVGIVGLRLNDDNAVEAECYNYTASKVEANVELRLDDKVVSAKKITLAPDSQQRLAWTVNLRGDETLEVRLDRADGLAFDNSVKATLARRDIRVAVVGKGVDVITKALKAVNPHVRVEKFDTLPAGDEIDFGVYAHDAVPPVKAGEATPVKTLSQWPSYPTLEVIHVSALSKDGFAVVAPKESPLAGVSFDGVVLPVIDLDPAKQAGYTPWVSTKAGKPVLGLMRDRTSWRFRLTSDPRQGKWAEHSSFPLMVAEMMRFTFPGHIQYTGPAPSLIQSDNRGSTDRETVAARISKVEKIPLFTTFHGRRYLFYGVGVLLVLAWLVAWVKRYRHKGPPEVTESEPIVRV